MAIGTSITPRGYDIDETGKAYTLDPRPLLDAQNRTFQLQRESMNAVYETGRKGVAFAEYLGARQQLGRMRAELGDLDPNDPLFPQKYSDILGRNSLALTHEKTGPVAKMVLAPIVGEAARVRSHADEMEKVRAQAVNRANELGIRYGYQGALQEGRLESSERQTRWRLDDPREFAPGRPQQRQAWEWAMGLDDVTATPESQNLPPSERAPLATRQEGGTRVPTGVGGPDADLYPLPTGTGNLDLLPDLYGSPPVSAPAASPLRPGAPAGRGGVVIPFRGPAPRAGDVAPFSPPEEDVTVPPDPTPVEQRVVPGAGDAPEPEAVVAAAQKQTKPAPEQAPAPKAFKVGERHPEYGWVATPAGWMRITKVGADMTLEPVVRAEKPEAPKGYIALGETFNEDSSPSKWKLEKEVERSAAEIKKLDDDIQIRLAADPEIGQFSAAVLGKKAELGSLETQLKFHEGEKDEAKIKEVTPKIEVLRKELELADAAGKEMTERKKHQYLNILDPQYAAQTQALIQDARAEQMRTESLQGPPEPPVVEPEVTDTPPPPPPPGPPLPTHEMLRRQDPKNIAIDRVWTEEKTFALDAARDLAVKLGLPEDAVINAVEAKDNKSLDAILGAAHGRGVQSPLVRTEVRTPMTGTPGPSRGVEMGAWARSKVGKDYLEVLRRAVEDTSIPRRRSLSGKSPGGNSVQLVSPFKEKK